MRCDAMRCDTMRPHSQEESQTNRGTDRTLPWLPPTPAHAQREIINEPEGSFKISTDGDPCFDTSSVLAGSGAGWTGGNWPIKDVLRFVNLQAAAIHAADPKALVTVGSWSQYASTDADGSSLGDGGRKFRNYYKDECLVGAGGKAKGVLDFFQVNQFRAKREKTLTARGEKLTRLCSHAPSLRSSPRALNRSTRTQIMARLPRALRLALASERAPLRTSSRSRC